MSKDFRFISRTIFLAIFGNFDFFNTSDFEEYFKSRYKIGERQVYIIVFFFFIFSLIFIGFQMFILKSVSFEDILMEILLVLIFLRLINRIILTQFQEYSTSIETIGYFVVNELLVILDTSHSLKEALKFIILGNYPLFSKTFETAMVQTHFGYSLEFSLKYQIKKCLNGNIQTIFLNILEIWENGKNMALLSKDKILNRISEQITEETSKIDSWASLSSGIIYLSPPIMLCFLLISGNMNVLFGITIIIYIVVGSFFFHPERHLTVFSRNNEILNYDNKSLEFLIILSENLLKGSSFDKSLSDSLKIIENDIYRDHLVIKSEHLTQFRLGLTQEEEIKEIFSPEIFSERISQLVLLIKKFSMIDSYIAGKKLLTMTTELSKTNELLKKGKAQLTATKFHGNVIQILALISLAFIAGASPLFLFVSSMLSQSSTESAIRMDHSIFELIYFIIAILISVLPIKGVEIRNFRKYNRIPWRNIFGLSRFTLFLIVYMFLKNLLTGLY
ncbi:MAG: hypothetical protein ACFFB2_10810 [Promethearchaeota archaeon]